MDDVIWQQWVSDWQESLETMRRCGYETGELHIAPPATQKQVEALEAELGCALPADFRYVITHYSTRVSLYWHLGRSLPEEEWQRREFPAPYQEIFSSWADALWDSRMLFDPLKEYIYSDDPRWKHKIAFLNVPNGDCIAFDLTEGTDNCPIVYLSHENGTNQGRVLASNFVEFITRWSALGCPGPEDFQMEPFLGDGDSGLQERGATIEQWKHLLQERCR